jgi:uncharacterized protein YutE (UPF0331/DUF86 family)
MLVKMEMDSVIIRKIGELEKSIQQLRKFQSYSYKEIEGDLQKLWAIKHGLQISIQMIIDIGNHILAEIGENQIDGYSHIFDGLEKLDILTQDFSENMQTVAEFRNMLVYKYDEVDTRVLYDILQNKRYDFERFIGYIQSYFT